MLRSVFAKTLRDSRNALIGWSAGMMALALATIAIWPTVRDSDLGDFVEDLPETLLAIFGISEEFDFLSPVGFINGRVFSALGPLLILMFAIGLGARLIAGEEEAGTLDLLLTNPVSRRRVVLEKFAALCLLTAAVGLSLFLVIWVGAIPVDLDLSFEGVFAASLAVTLLGLFFGSMGLAVGAATGKRALSLGIVTTVAVTTYFLWSLAPLVDFLDAVKPVSPWFYAQEDVPLANGLPVLRALALVAGVAVFGWLAAVAFERRDVGV